MSGMPDEAFPDAVHSAWLAFKAAMKAAGADGTPRVSLGQNCPDREEFQRIWEQDGKDFPWEAE